MNSANAQQSSWKTSDGSPWWLKSVGTNEPNGDYTANCFLSVSALPNSPGKGPSFNDGSCRYRSNAYYCQPKAIKTCGSQGNNAGAALPGMPVSTSTPCECQEKCSIDAKCRAWTHDGTSCYLRAEYGIELKSSTARSDQKTVSETPNSGSPSTCRCNEIMLSRFYSAGSLVQCVGCLDVSKSIQKNSCPKGTKIFSPASLTDWQAIVATLGTGGLGAIRSPHLIVDVTRPSNGCGGCKGSSMNSQNAQQSTWKTSDGSPWWLRSSTHNEPSGDYYANCFLNLYDADTTPESMTFNDAKCGYHSKSYLCQPSPPTMRTVAPTTPTVAGSFSVKMSSAHASLLATSPKAKAAFAEAFSRTIGLTASDVVIKAIYVNGKKIARRLQNSSVPRRLAGSTVKVDYTAKTTKTVDASTVSASALQANIQVQAFAIGITVVITAPPTISAPVCKDWDLRIHKPVVEATCTTAEMYMAGHWHPICGLNFDRNQIGAQAVCRQLGYGSGSLKKMMKSYNEPAIAVQMCSSSANGRSDWPFGSGSTSLADCVSTGDAKTGSMYEDCGVGYPVAIEICCTGGSSSSRKLSTCSSALAIKNGRAASVSSGEQMLFTSPAANALFKNSWSGWTSSLSSYSSNPGKRDEYNTMPLEAIRFTDEDVGNRWAQYSLFSYYRGSSLLEIVKDCMGTSSCSCSSSSCCKENTGKGKWFVGHCSIGTLQAASGMCGLSTTLRVGVGDGAVDASDWALFMVRPLEALSVNKDFSGSGIWAIGSEKAANTGKRMLGAKIISVGQVSIIGISKKSGGHPAASLPANSTYTQAYGLSYMYSSQPSCSNSAAADIQSSAECLVAVEKLRQRRRVKAPISASKSQKSSAPPYCWQYSSAGVVWPSFNEGGSARTAYRDGRNSGTCTSQRRRVLSKCLCVKAVTDFAEIARNHHCSNTGSATISDKKVTSAFACQELCVRQETCEYVAYDTNKYQGQCITYKGSPIGNVHMIPQACDQSRCATKSCTFTIWSKKTSRQGSDGNGVKYGQPVAVVSSQVLGDCPIDRRRRTSEANDPSPRRRRTQSTSTTPRRRIGERRRRSESSASISRTFVGPGVKIIRQSSDVVRDYGKLRLDQRNFDFIRVSGGDEEDPGATSQVLGSSMSGSRSPQSSYSECMNAWGCDSSQIFNSESEFHTSQESCGSSDFICGTVGSSGTHFIGGSKDQNDGPKQQLCGLQGMLFCPDATTAKCDAAKTLTCSPPDKTETEIVDKEMFADLCELQKFASCPGTCVRSCSQCHAGFRQGSALVGGTSRCFQMKHDSSTKRKITSGVCRPRGTPGFCDAGQGTEMLFEYLASHQEAMPAGNNNGYSSNSNWSDSNSSGCFSSLVLLPTYIICYLIFWFGVFPFGVVYPLWKKICNRRSAVAPAPPAAAPAAAQWGAPGLVPSQAALLKSKSMGAYVPSAPVSTNTQIANMKGSRDSWAPEANSMRSDVPAYWANSRDYGEKEFDEMVYVPTDQHEVFEKLLKDTYVARCTQDRPCPKNTGGCGKVPGGCPCNRPGGDPGLPTGYIVRRVIRVEESDMFEGYKKKRDEIKASRSEATGDDSCQPFSPPLMTNEAASRHPEVFEKLDESINECYLWHGSNIQAVMSIAQNDFKMDLSGTGVGSMYGLGAYFAEACTKADEYAHDEPGGYYEEIFPLLLCRICMGKFYYTEKKGDQEGANKQKTGEVDSVMGDRAKAANTFRELVVFDKDQIYPEYILFVTRVHAADDEAELRKSAMHVPFQAQLPVYWKNCHLDPFKDSFAEQFKVRAKTMVFLQKLVSECNSRGMEIIEAHRVENATMYSQYVTFKKALMDSDDRCIPVNELDGNPSSGYALTMHKMAAYETSSVICLANIDMSINEMLLWHGTSKDAMEKIAKGGFRIPKGSEIAHGARFGNGAYLAESLDKSLDYASTDGGVQHVMLCRALCGKMYYTEASSERYAHDKARSDDKVSVLANPNGSGPREFIVLEENQVYPEFLMVLKRKE